MPQPTLMWTTMDDRLDGLVLAVRGELSTATAPALESFLDLLVAARERVVALDLRDARILPPAADRLLERWGALPGVVPGTWLLSA
jgi:anti-anti-sigma regulatory factor